MIYSTTLDVEARTQTQSISAEIDKLEEIKRNREVI